MKLTKEQINQLNMYSVYTEQPERPLFTFQDVLHSSKIECILKKVQATSKSPNQTVAASFFLRRIGLFISMQFYFLVFDAKVWKGSPENLQFGKNHEYGTDTISVFVREQDWLDIQNHEETIHIILHEQVQAIIDQVRTVTNLSALTLWENIFSYLLWHYHVFLEKAETEKIARKHLTLLKSDALWQGISNTSLYESYSKGLEPAALLNTTVRTTCCFSKDVPGLMQCGFCPLKLKKTVD